MPMIEITIVEGRSPAELRDLITRVTRSTHEAINADMSNIRVIIREVPASHWAAGDVTIAERKAPRADAVDLSGSGVAAIEGD